MDRISLKNNFISVANRNSKSSFGGSQEWFVDPAWGNISRQGCGIIAAVDTMLYILGPQDVSYEKYADTIDRFRAERKLSRLFMKEFPIRIYDNTKVAIGILPFQMSGFLNKKMKAKGYKLRFKWNGIHGHRDMYQKMQSMISRNIPVVWALYSRKGAVRLYVKSNDGMGYKDVGITTNNHYVTVTGIIENVPSHRKLIEISSWGKCYYIDYDEYLEYVGSSLISKYCSNILYTK